MISPWRCLDCGATVSNQADKCDLCNVTIEEQSVLDLDAFMFRDNYRDRDDDEYRRAHGRMQRKDADDDMREMRDRLMRQSR